MIAVCAGSRSLVMPDLLIAEAHGSRLAQFGWRVRTGGAPGADQAFALGVSIVNPALLELFLPWASFEERAHTPQTTFWTAAAAARPEHVALAQEAHTGWFTFGHAAQLLLTRNAMMVLGFNEPADHLFAWPDRDKPGLGGTGHILRCAEIAGVPSTLMGDS